MQLFDSWRKYTISYEESHKELVEATFKRFLKDTDISVILITQDASEKYVRNLIIGR